MLLILMLQTHTAEQIHHKISQDFNHQLQTTTAALMSCGGTQRHLSQGETLIDNTSFSVNVWFDYPTATVGQRHSVA